jgi:hypothetical protein
VSPLFELINHRDREIFHRNMTLAPSIAKQSIAAEPKAARATTSSASKPDQPREQLRWIKQPFELYRRAVYSTTPISF